MRLRSLLRLALPYRWSLLALMLLFVVSSLITLFVPWVAGQLLGGVTLERARLMNLLFLLIGALIVLASLSSITIYLSGSTNARLLADLRVRIYAHLQHLPLGFHHDRLQGDVLALATFEVGRLGRFLTGTLVSLPAKILTAIGASILMFRIDPKLALLVPALVPAFYLILKLIGRRLRWLAVATQQAEADVVATIERNLTILPAIKAFTRELAETEHYRRKVERSMKISVEKARIDAALEPLIGLVAAIAAVLLLYAAGQNVRSGAMTGADLFSFLFYAALLTRPVGALAHVYGELQTARGTLERLQSVLNEDTEPGYSGGGSMPVLRGDLQFVGVSFGYPGRRTLLKNANLHIRAGEKVALIGDNGAGKTTLVNLLLRFVDPDEGSVRLDGQDTVSFHVQDLRRQVGVVPQHAALFNGTIRDNIAFGLEGATDAQVMGAARLAQAHDFIVALPDGYDTQIGDHGVRLSGGQRQRVSLARALVKNPPILVFDEATSMFDLEGELAFIEASADALKGRTVLLITHRPAILSVADRIISVDSGVVRDVAAPFETEVAAAIR